MKRIVLATTFLAQLCLSVPSQAQELTHDAQNQIKARISVLQGFIEVGDFSSSLDVIPPRMLDAMAANVGMSPAAFREAAKTAADSMMRGVTVVSYSMDFDASDVYRLPNTERTYLLIPTETILEVAESRVTSRSETLALEDGGEWYLVRVSDKPQAALIGEIYPEFASVEFPSGQTVIDE